LDKTDPTTLGKGNGKEVKKGKWKVENGKWEWRLKRAAVLAFSAWPLAISFFLFRSYLKANS
jgi:hypothetical protein